MVNSSRRARSRDDVRIDAFELKGTAERLVVVSLPNAGAPIPESLTAAEREVARDAAQGLSNAEIAAKRGRSVRTIANQLAAIYQKLGISSRAELTILLNAGTP